MTLKGKKHNHAVRYLLKNILQVFRQLDGLSFIPRLIELTEGHVRENVVDHVGCKDPTTAGRKQRGAILLKKYRVLKEAGRHTGLLSLADFLSATCSKLQ